MQHSFLSLFIAFFFILFILLPFSSNGAVNIALRNSIQNATENSCLYTADGIDITRCKPFTEGFIRSAMYSVMSFNGSFGNVEFNMPISAPTSNMPLIVGKLMMKEFSNPCDESSLNTLFPKQTTQYNPFWNLPIEQYMRTFKSITGTIKECTLTSETLVIYDLNENYPKLNQDFQKVLDSLPIQYDDESYSFFFKTYGFGVALVKYGGNRIHGKVKWQNSNSLSEERELVLNYGWKFHQDRTYWLYRVYEKPSVVDFQVKRLSSFLVDYPQVSRFVIDNLKRKEDAIIAFLNKTT